MTDLFVEAVTEADLARRVEQLGTEIAADYEGSVPVLVGVLNGCVPFMADLARAIPGDVEIDFLSLTRFGSEGRVNVAMDTSLTLTGRDVVIVEDIVDTGLTLTALHRMLETREPRSMRTVALLDKAPRRIVEVDVDYRGFEVGDEFLLGYGLDWDGWYRNVPSLWAVMDLAAFADDPSAFERVWTASRAGSAQ